MLNRCLALWDPDFILNWSIFLSVSSHFPSSILFSHLPHITQIVTVTSSHNNKYSSWTHLGLLLSCLTRRNKHCYVAATGVLCLLTHLILNLKHSLLASLHSLDQMMKTEQQIIKIWRRAPVEQWEFARFMKRSPTFTQSKETSQPWSCLLIVQFQPRNT